MWTDSKDFFVWPTNFSCVLILGDMILPSDYTLTIGMMPKSVHGESTAIGLHKIKQFISKFVQNSTLINIDHHLLPHITEFKTNVVHLPQDPTDYLFANILFKKLTAISADYFTINEITVDSSIGDRVQYRISNSCNVYDTMLNNDNWWNEDNVKTNEIDQFPSWEDLDITVSSKFSPKLITGGKRGNKPV